MSNTPLQKRTGFNQGSQPSTLASTRYAGQPGVKMTGPSMIIFRNSPLIPGDVSPRGIGMNPASYAGVVFNANAAPVTVVGFIVDALGNSMDDPTPITIAGLGYNSLFVGLGGFVPLLPGWSSGLRVTAGAWQDVTVWPWSHDMEDNMVVLAEPLSTTELVIGPGKGRAWQLCGDVASSYYGAGNAITYWNFDSGDRVITDEKVNLAGDDFNINAAPLTVGDGEVEHALEDLLDKETKGFILAYPDTLKFTAGENQVVAPIYLIASFCEFDLPRDQG